MGRITAAILPLAAVVAVVITVTQPLGSRSIVLIVADLALAGLALLAAGLAGARARRR